MGYDKCQCSLRGQGIPAGSHAVWLNAPSCATDVLIRTALCNAVCAGRARWLNGDEGCFAGNPLAAVGARASLFGRGQRLWHSVSRLE